MNSRKVALKILSEVAEGAYSNLALDKYLTNVQDKRDRALITEMVYGVLRLQNRLDFVIKQYSRIPLKKMDDEVLLALRIALYQILYLDRIPESAAVNETINAIKGMTNRGAVGFVNGLLRNIIRSKNKIRFPEAEDIDSYLINYLSHPEWLVNYWKKIYGLKKTIKLCKYNNQPAEVVIRTNTLKYSNQEIVHSFSEKDIQLLPTGIPDTYLIKNFNNIEELPLFEEGGFIVQGPAAVLAGHILNPQPGMRILDMAAAPGVKTTHLAALMENKGEITALDIYDHKLDLIQENCKRLGIDIVKTLKQDSSTYHSEDKYDMILLDAPCSGLGLIRQKPEIRWTKSMKDIEILSDIQFEMLKNSIELLKKGGFLLYSTCTLAKEENQKNVDNIITTYKNQLEISDIKNDLVRLNLENEYDVTDKGYLELFPPENHTEGFFIAKLQKK
ncbi:MAG: 16S rRNA (cytosine(967)-C(5))-methyltransferase RsmB [bacterium]